MASRFPFRLPPVPFLALALALGLAVAVVSTWLALQPGWLGLRLRWTEEGARVERAVGPAAEVPVGTVVTEIEGGGERLEFEALDFVTEPDGMMGDYGTYRVFLGRLDRLAEIQSAERVSLGTDGRRLEIRPARRGRPWTDLPPDFWVQVTVGLVAWLVSAAVFVFRPADTSARYLLLSGAATLLFAPAAAIYTTRELGMDGRVVQWASDLNFLGGSLFAASFVGLLLYYPRAIAPRWVGRAVVALFVLWFGLQQVEVFESMTFARRFLVMLAVVATFALAGVHWFQTRRDPVERAALQWFLLSWLLGTGLFAVLILLPQMFGVDTSPVQGYAFLLFLLVYGGLAFGILRFRLFELGAWWRRIVAWAATALVLVLLDLLFVGGLNLSSEVSLALAVVISGMLWLPLRGLIWERLAGRNGGTRNARFSELLEVALASRDEAAAKWQAVWQGVFDPLRIERSDEPAGIHGNGLALVVPRVRALDGLRLEYARAGRDLFSPRDAETAREMVDMLRHAMESVSAYRKGVEEERGRIARDVHDNVGAQLLSALHSREAAGKDEQIRRTLTGLREMIRDAQPEAAEVGEVLADLRFETCERLAASGHELDWEEEEGMRGGLTPATVHALRSVVREAVSNVIRHAGAGTVKVRVRQNHGMLDLVLTDDGRGFTAGTDAFGNGLANMRMRVEELGGRFAVESGPAGTRVRVSLTISPAEN